MTPTDELPALPFERPDVLDVPPVLRHLQAEHPICRVRTPAGDPAWLVTRYDDVRALFADARLGRSHPDPGRAPRYSNSALLGAPMVSRDAEQAEQARMRRVLTRSFMVKRMNALRPRVQALVDGVLDRIDELPQPVDLHVELALPVPILVICELLGVPYEDRDRFRQWSDDAGNFADRERAHAGLAALHTYMREQLRERRRERREDVLSDLVAEGDADPTFTEDRMTGIAGGLLFAGHETTVTRIDFGVLLLLTDDDQRRALLADPALVPGAVEEILRVAVPGAGVLPRYALADIEIADVLIRDGDLVLLSAAIANRDGRAFREPDRFDVRRDQHQHLTFGHGHHFCLGAGLARVELQTVIGTLFHRFPTLRLAVPIEQLPRREGFLTGGLEALPVVW